VRRKKRGKKWLSSTNSAVSKPHFDAILDCGANDIYLFPKYMKRRPLISLIRQDLSHLVIRAVYLHMPLPNMEC
jgi:hypothetical protein